MHPTKWLIISVAMVTAAAAAGAAVNVAVDIYGLYHSGARRLVYGDPRVAKYLLSQRYVPEHFDSVLAGPSLSANWNLSGIEKLRVYNNSLNGANSVETEALVAASLSRPGISVVFMIVHPALTFTHDFKTTPLTEELRRSSLGSVSLWQAYVDALNIFIGRSRQRFDFAGTEAPEFVATKMNENMKRLWNAGTAFPVDCVALAAYRRTIANVYARGARIVFVVPPTAESLLERKRIPFDQYAQGVRAEFGVGADWVDFTTVEYKAFRSDPANFTDGVHFTAAAARYVVAELNAKVNASLVSGCLRGIMPKQR